jgi:hypothetical protein
MLTSIALLLLLAPAVAAAQTAPPPPPPPPPPVVVPPVVVPPAPRVAPMPPLPALPPMPDVWAVRPAPEVMMVEPWAVPRADVQWAPMDLPDVAFLADQAREAARASVEWTEPFLVDAGRLGGFSLVSTTYAQEGSDASAYNSAMSSMNRRDYEAAVTRFDRVIAQKGARADAALYWKGFSQYKLGHSDDALGTIAALRRDYPQSRYLNDAKVLEADVRRTAGQPVNPAAIDDDELKLLAIQGLQRSDPNGAVPLLEGVLTANNSLRVKQGALYVMALSDLPQAREILMRYAKGGGNPDLQLQAISHIASRRDKETTGADLRAIYESSTDTSVRMAVISAYRSAGDKPALISVVSDGRAPMAIRSRAFSSLSNLAAPQEGWALSQ